MEISGLWKNVMEICILQLDGKVNLEMEEALADIIFPRIVGKVMFGLKAEEALMMMMQ